MESMGKEVETFPKLDLNLVQTVRMHPTSSHPTGWSSQHMFTSLQFVFIDGGLSYSPQVSDGYCREK